MINQTPRDRVPSLRHLAQTCAGRRKPADTAWRWNHAHTQHLFICDLRTRDRVREVANLAIEVRTPPSEVLDLSGLCDCTRTTSESTLCLRSSVTSSSESYRPYSFKLIFFGHLVYRKLCCCFITSILRLRQSASPRSSTAAPASTRCSLKHSSQRSLTAPSSSSLRCHHRHGEAGESERVVMPVAR